MPSSTTAADERQPQAGRMGIVVGLIGAISIGMTNRIRHRPLMYRECYGQLKGCIYHAKSAVK
jgi:hypothetical protein